MNQTLTTRNVMTPKATFSVGQKKVISFYSNKTIVENKDWKYNEHIEKESVLDLFIGE